MTLKHSPGPWTYDSDAYRIMRESDEYHVVAGFDDRDLPTKADGSLMAAAPDMLRLLRMLARIPLEQARLGIGPKTAIKEARKMLQELEGDTCPGN